MRKTCRKCGRPIEGANRGGRGQCLACKAEYQKTHYRDNKGYYVWKGNASKQRLVDRNQRALLEYLASHPCVDCGELDPLVLEFDHREPADKVLNVNELAGRVGLDRVFAEVAKCDVRCANCHRRKTARENHHVRYVILQELQAGS